MKLVLYKKILRLVLFLRNILQRMRIFFLAAKNVKIGKNCYIAADAVFNTQWGGEIIVGDDCHILSGTKLMTYGGRIEIGNRVGINPYCILYGHGGLKINDDVLIAAHTVIIPANHNFKSKTIPINKQGLNLQGITIENNCWVGAHTCILDGVHIRTGSVIAAGCVVTKDTDAYTVNGGVPNRQLYKY